MQRKIIKKALNGIRTLIKLRCGNLENENKYWLKEKEWICSVTKKEITWYNLLRNIELQKLYCEFIYKIRKKYKREERKNIW